MSLCISVTDGDWGGALPADIGAVVDSVARCFDGAIVERLVEPVLVEPTTRPTDPPLTALRRTKDGNIRVLLNVRGNYWAQLAFQFAHELCHVLANFCEPLQHPSKWIEESLCEAASLFALNRMADSWKSTPPYPNWASYSAELTKYAIERCSVAEHRLPAGMAFHQWLASKLPLLQCDCARRADNTVVAQQLLPIFEHDADAWRSIRYLNLWDASQDTSVRQFCEHWRGTTPSLLRSVVDSIAQRLTLD
jgi:hypothetical protein